MKRTWVWAVPAAVALGLAAWFLGPRDRAPDGPRGAGRSLEIPVECAPLTRGGIRDVRSFTGSLLPRARYVVAPKTAGRLVSVSVRIGDPVGAGRLLARLDDEEHVQQVEQARAALEVAGAAVEQQETAWAQAVRERERVRALRERGIASEAEWDAARSEAEAQEARLRVARAQRAERASALKAAEVRLSYTRILPLEDEGDWFVEERFVDEGAMLAPNTPIFSLVDIGALVAVIQVIERDYPALRPGLSVSLETDAFPGEAFEGRIARVAPALRESSRQARVEIDVPNRPPRLRPGMFVRARIEFDRRDDALLAPAAALVSREGRTGLFRIDPESGAVRFVEVRVGIRTPEAVEILEPRLDGRVVTLGQHLLSDGARVRSRAADDADCGAPPDPPGRPDPPA